MSPEASSEQSDACRAGLGDREVGLKCVMRGAVENRVKIEVSHDVSGSNSEPAVGIACSSQVTVCLSVSAYVYV